MSKKISITILCTIVTAFFALFTATEVMALDPCDPLLSCDADNYTFTAQFVNGEFPEKVTIKIPGDTGTCSDAVTITAYKYQFDISGPLNRLDHVAFGLPYDCDNPTLVYETICDPPENDAWDYYAPCLGTADDKWLQYDCTNQALRINPQGNKAWFYTNLGSTGPISAYYSAGNKEGGCTDPEGLIGPNPFGKSYYVIFNAVEEMIFLNKKWCITKNSDGCPVAVSVCPTTTTACGDASCRDLEMVPMSEVTVGGSGLVHTGAPGVECGYSFFSGEGSPHRDYICGGGYCFPYCYDLANPCNDAYYSCEPCP
jgi:hypothetical protein